MASQIMFFQKNRLDLDFDNVTITASQGSEYVDFLRNRSRRSGWATQGSVDADNTTLVVDLVDPTEIDNIILNGHNFASYKIENWNGSAYVDFSTIIDVTGNTATTNRHTFTKIVTTKFKVTIRGTQTPNDDKFLIEIYAGTIVGQLAGWPVIKEPTVSRARKAQTMLSGKSSIRENIGTFKTKLSVSNWKSDADLDIVETLYESIEGFHVWLSGGDEDQFSSVRLGYRKKDFPLMKCANEFRPEFVKGLYKSGMKIDIDLVEVVD